MALALLPHWSLPTCFLNSRFDGLREGQAETSGGSPREEGLAASSGLHFIGLFLGCLERELGLTAVPEWAEMYPER